MSENLDMLSRLEALLKHKKSKKYYAEKLDITEIEVDELMKELKERESDDVNSTLTTATEIHTTATKVNVEKGTLESTIVLDFEPKDDLELAKLHKINLDKYIITNYWTKLLPSGNFTSSVFCKIKTPKDYSPEDFLKFLENYKSNYKPVSAPKHNEEKDLIDLEVSISDYHLAKKHIDDNDTLQYRVDRFIEVVQNLVNKAEKVYDIDRIVFPISNDFFHTDNYHNQTTNGTPQDTIADYASEYEAGFSALVDSIKFLLSKANDVKVVLVQGNHDRTKSYYLAHALDTYFRDEQRVQFDRDSMLIKGVMLGQTFIGYHHGNCKLDDLPLLFATSPYFDAMFGIAKYREVHTGDKHHYMAKETKGVRIQQMPSLSGTDRWHSDNNFVHSIRAALALVYDKEMGKIAEFEERL